MKFHPCSTAHHAAAAALLLGSTSSAHSQQSGGACPLTPAQEVAAVNAFKSMAPVFREPRCINCHGAVNPYARDGGHKGGYIDIRREARKILTLTPADRQESLLDHAVPLSEIPQHLDKIRKIAESRPEVTNNDVIRQNAFVPMREACADCHIDSWVIPMRANHFVRKSDRELCIQMKRRTDGGAPAFLTHMARDFDVLEGFKGTRGLKDPLPPIPPTMEFSFLQRTAKAWVQAMGGKFHRPDDCGCSLKGFVLQIEHQLDTDLEDGGMKGGVFEYSGTVDFLVRLEPVPRMPAGWFTGQASIERPLSMHHVKCTGELKPRREEWDVRAILDQTGKSMKFLFTFDNTDVLGTVTCPGPFPFTDEINWGMFSELTHKLDMRIPITWGATAEFTAEVPGIRERLSVTVLNGPGTNQ